MKTKSLVACGVIFVIGLALCYYLTDRSALERGKQIGIAETTATERANAEKLVAAVSSRFEAEKELIRIQALEQGRREVIARLEADKAAAEQAAASKVSSAAGPKSAAQEIATGPSPYGKVKVLVVGLNYEGTAITPKLRFAVKDATAAAELLETKFRFEVTPLIGEKATYAHIKETLQALLAELGPNDDFLFYFNGHGTTLSDSPTQRGGLLLPHDAAALSSDNTTQRAHGIEIRWLAELLKNSKGRHRLAILDSCFSGLPQISGPPPALANNDADDPLAYGSVQLITAGAENERSFELDKIGGVFSFELRKALESEEAGPQSLLRLFFSVRDSVTRKSDYVTAMNGRPPSPQHRSLESTRGDFVFVRPKDYAAWIASRRVSAKVEGYDIPVAEEEYRTVLAQQPPPPPEDTATAGIPILKKFKIPLPGFLGGKTAPKAAPPPAAPALSADQLRRYEARASMGDANALGILSAVSGRSNDPAKQKLAREYAFTAFETGGKSGQAALGLAYAEGYGGNKLPSIGAELLGNSGFKDAAPWIGDMLIAAVGYEAIRSDDPKTRMAGAMNLAVAGKGFLSRLGKAPAEKVSDHFKAVRTLVNASPPDFAKALKRLEDATTELDKDKDLDGNAKTGLLTAVATVREACEKKDAPATAKLVDDWFANAGQK